MIIHHHQSINQLVNWPHSKKTLYWTIYNSGNSIDREEWELFIFTRQEGEDIPWDVIRTSESIHSSFKVIQDHAIHNRMQLITVILNSGLGPWCIGMPCVIKAIIMKHSMSSQSCGCLGDELEEIGEFARMHIIRMHYHNPHYQCQEIIDGSFEDCSNVTHLEFCNCTKLTSLLPARWCRFGRIRVFMKRPSDIPDCLGLVVQVRSWQSHHYLQYVRAHFGPSSPRVRIHFLN